MRYLVQTRLGKEFEESYFTVAAPENPREAVAIAKFLRVLDPLDPEGEPLREAIVIDELTEEEQFDGILRAEHQLAEVEPELATRLATIGETDAARVTHADMREFVHSHCWEAAGVEDDGGDALDA
jgi:hypothetical protein